MTKDKNNKDKFKDLELTEYEMDLEDNADNASSLSAAEKKREFAALESAAKNYQKKNERICIRMHGNDLENIKRIAMHEGMPYQTLITSILHKFAQGTLNLHNRN